MRIVRNWEEGAMAQMGHSGHTLTLALPFPSSIVSPPTFLETSNALSTGIEEACSEHRSCCHGELSCQKSHSASCESELKVSQVGLEEKCLPVLHRKEGEQNSSFGREILGRLQMLASDVTCEEKTGRPRCDGEGADIEYLKEKNNRGHWRDEVREQRVVGIGCVQTGGGCRGLLSCRVQRKERIRSTSGR